MGYEKKGYLRSDYRLFYLDKAPDHAIAFHYHDFHKVVVLVKGEIGYIVEGRHYTMRSGDIVLVGAGEIHRPVVEGQVPYERLILYLSPAFAGSFGEEGGILLDCMEKSRISHQNLLRPKGGDEAVFSGITSALVDTFRGAEDPHRLLLQRLKVAELLLRMDACLSEPGGGFESQIGSGDEVTRRCIAYVNDHLLEEGLAVDQVADALFLSRSYLMHRFKQETGYTLMEFVREKRLFLAQNLLSQGASVNDACFQSGFRNYAAFYYAYKKRYQHPPTTGGAPVQGLREE